MNLYLYYSKIKYNFSCLFYFYVSLINVFLLHIYYQQKLIVELVKIQSDGTVEVDLSKSAPVASELFEYQSIEGYHPDMDLIVTDSNKSIPKLKIAVLVVGTRGDVQPFLAISKRLQACL